MLYVSDIIREGEGTLLQGDLSLVLDSFSHDTRTIKEGDIYVGIKGESFDGNKFFIDALAKGAKGCILDNVSKEDIPEKYKDRFIVKVKNSLKCIQNLAKYKRSLYNIPVIGVTGSVGKTSTKDMIYSVLREKYKVLKTEGNNNNHIGLPFTILRLKDEEVMILEMGMNNLGEISFLTNIAKPTIAVITNIGTAHIGNLGSRENIMKAKLEIVEGLSGPLVINNDNDMMHDHLKKIRKLNEVITFGIDNSSDYMAYDIDGNKFKIDGKDFYSPIGNRAFIYNALTAYVIGRLCNVEVDKIKRGIKNLELTSNRLEYKESRLGAILIDDTYNASLDSIKSSLEILSKEKAERKIAIIGDVLELGKYSKDIHMEIGKELLKNNLDYIVTIGIETKYTDDYLANKGFNNIKHFNKENESYEYLDGFLRKGDVVLIKGSHGINLKNVVNYLIKK